MDDIHSDGIEYATYTAAELIARRAQYKASQHSQTPDAIRARARRLKLKESDLNYLIKRL